MGTNHGNHRPKFDLRTGSHKSYKQFLKENPEEKGLTYKKYLEIITTINEEYSEYVVDGNLVEIPFGIGKLAIAWRVKHRHINWKETDKYNHNRKEGEPKKLIYFLRESTDGYCFKWFFSFGSKIPSVKIWCFIPSNKNKRYFNQRVLAEEELFQRYRKYT